MRFYRTLLHLFPRSFRAEYGAEMEGVFARDRKATHGVAMAALVAITIVDVGAVLAYAAGRSMQALLFGVDPADLVVFAAAIGLSLLMALAGSIIPAWRAIRVDPIAATRAD